MFRDADRSLPVLAITFNHRREAFYRADEIAPNCSAMMATKAHPLQGCRMLAHDAPIYCVKELVKLHNLSHGGSGLNIWDMVDHSLELEQQWSVYAQEKGITTANASLSFA